MAEQKNVTSSPCATPLGLRVLPRCPQFGHGKNCAASGGLPVLSVASRLLKKASQNLRMRLVHGWKRCFSMKILGLAMLVSLLVLGPGQLPAANSPLGVLPPPSTNQPTTGLQISMGWDPSPDANITGYYVCWGLATGQCTNLIDVGNLTEVTLGSLVTNVFYFFTVVAYDAVGNKAQPSNEIQYMGTNAPAVIAPLIVTDLTNQTVALASSVSLVVSATGSQPLDYSWRFNGQALQVADSNVLILGNLTSQQVGQYQVVISNSAGSVTSSIASVSGLIPPTITTDLSSQTIGAGSNVTFQVGVSGAAPFNYQWVSNGTDLPGANSSSLTFNNVGQQQSGTYQVLVSNPVGTASSSIATLSVLNPPGILVNLTNQSVPVGSNVTFRVSASGSAPLTYQWLFNGSAVNGATTTSLTMKKVSSTTAGVYQVIVSNAVGVGSSSAQLIVLSAPIITSDPTNLTVALGSNATFSAGVSGASPLIYQWFFNGTNLVGATANPLVITNVDVAQAGTYQLIASNSLGAATSALATLTVSAPPAIVTDLTNRIAISGSNVTLQIKASGIGPLTYQWLFSGSPLPGATSNSLTFASVSPANAGSYQVLVANSLGSAQSAVAALEVIAPRSLSISPFNGDLFSLSFAGMAGQTYTVQYSPNLTSWFDAGTATADASGIAVFTANRTAPSTLYRVLPPGGS